MNHKNRRRVRAFFRAIIEFLLYKNLFEGYYPSCSFNSEILNYKKVDVSGELSVNEIKYLKKNNLHELYSFIKRALVESRKKNASVFFEYEITTKTRFDTTVTEKVCVVIFNYYNEKNIRSLLSFIEDYYSKSSLYLHYQNPCFGVYKSYDKYSRFVGANKIYGILYPYIYDIGSGAREALLPEYIVKSGNKERVRANSYSYKNTGDKIMPFYSYKNYPKIRFWVEDIADKLIMLLSKVQLICTIINSTIAKTISINYLCSHAKKNIQVKR